MKREETIKVLTRILEKKKGDMDALRISIDSLRIAIHEVESAEDGFITAPHKGTFKEEITSAIQEVLADGPLHRSVILAKIQERGLYIGGGIRTVGAYLSTEDDFKNVGKGLWALAEPIAAIANPPLLPAEIGSNGHLLLEREPGTIATER